MYMCALIVEVMIAISSGPLNDMHLHIMNDLKNLRFFFQVPSLCVFFEQHQTKVSVSMFWQILDSSVNITFTKLSTCHDCFSLPHFNLIIFSLCVSTDFHLTFFYVNLISYSSVTNIDSCFNTSVFHSFCCTFCRL